jgi:hypothetical protein
MTQDGDVPVAARPPAARSALEGSCAAGAPSLRPTVDYAAIEREETVTRARMDRSPERHGDE